MSVEVVYDLTMSFVLRLAAVVSAAHALLAMAGKVAYAMVLYMTCSSWACVYVRACVCAGMSSLIRFDVSVLLCACVCVCVCLCVRKGVRTTTDTCLAWAQGLSMPRPGVPGFPGATQVGAPPSNQTQASPPLFFIPTAGVGGLPLASPFAQFPGQGMAKRTARQA
jgi:hypothetical protein